MFLSRFDWLTPPITLYYKGELQHSSIFSSIISILGYLSSIVIGLYLSIDFFKKLSPTVFCFNRFIEDSGIFAFDSRGIYHHFQILDTSKALPRKLDLSYIRVVGVEISIQLYLENKNTSNEDHWIYDLCNKGSDIESVENLYNDTEFNMSYCIKKYYNKKDNKYYSIDDQNFRWPHADHGTTNPNKTFYGLVFENCVEDDVWKEINGGIKCKTEKEIHEYVNKHYVRFYMTDYYPDVYNYKSPFQKYIYNIDSTLSSGSYTFNHINFNPSNIITHNGFFLDSSIETPAYIFDQNAIETGEYYGAYLAFYFWLKNKIIIYERTYKKVQDVLAEIDSMVDLIILIATIINNFISEYVTLRDTTHELFILRSKNVNRTEIERICKTRRRTIFQHNPPRRNNIPFNYYFNANKNDEKSEKDKMGRNIGKKSTYKSTAKRQILYSRATRKNKSHFSYLENSGNSGIYTNNKGNSTILKEKSSALGEVDKYSNIDKKEIPKEEERIDKIENVVDENIIPPFDPFKETKLHFLEFAYNYFFICMKKQNNIETYENFRMKIISEENLIQNYLDIHNMNKSLRQMTKDDGGDK